MEDTPTGDALSLVQRIQHPEVTDEERTQLYADLMALLRQLLRQWWEGLMETFTRFAEQVVVAFKPFLDYFAQWADSFWQRAYPMPERPYWKTRGYWKRVHREQKKARARLSLQYRRH